MSGRTSVIVVAVFAWLATAAITVKIFTTGPLIGPGQDTAAITLVKIGDTPDTPEAQNPQDAQAANAKPLPRYGVLPVFELTDQTGQPYGLNGLRGKVWVADTFFTRCTAICPTLASGMRDIQSALKLNPKLLDQVRLVSISVDGGHDSPEIIANFAKAYGADPDVWKFLTGERDVVWPLVQDGMKLPVEEGPPGDEDNILHSGKLLLIDRTGVIRGYYDGLAEAGRIKLLKDLHRLVSQE